MNEEFYLGGYWKGRMINVTEYVLESLNYLKVLVKVHPAFEDLEVYNKTTEKYIPVVLDEDFFKTTVFPLIFSDDTWYYKPNGMKDTNLTLESYSPTGFQMSYSNCKDKTLEIFIRAGMYQQLNNNGGAEKDEIYNNIILNFPQNKWQELYKLEEMEKLMSVSVNHWQPYHARIISHELSKQTHGKPPIMTGYLTFFQLDINIDGLEEYFSIKKVDGMGTLYILKIDNFSVENPECIQKVSMLENTLRRHDLLIV